MTAQFVGLDERGDLLEASRGTACRQIESQTIGEWRAAPHW